MKSATQMCQELRERAIVEKLLKKHKAKVTWEGTLDVKTDEIREVLEELLKSASGINPEWSSTQERITKTLSKLSALYKPKKPKIDKKKLREIILSVGRNKFCIDYFNLDTLVEEIVRGDILV